MLLKVHPIIKGSLTSQAVSEETKRGNEILTTAEILSREIHRVQQVNRLTALNIGGTQMSDLRCVALDMSAAVMNYLALATENLTRSFHRMARHWRRLMHRKCSALVYY